jgi:DNA-binding transcriptional MerR regulator
MTPSPSSAPGPYGLRDIRSLYPAVTENHLRYLEKWGLVRHTGAPRSERVYSFTDLLTIKQVAAELARGTPLKVILRSLLAEREGQLALDFHPVGDAPRPKVVELHVRRRAPDVASGPPLSAGGAAFPFSDPQAALAAKYFVEGSTTARTPTWSRRRPPTGRRSSSIPISCRRS